SRMIANAKRTNALDEYVAVTRIPIADQITRELLPTTGCCQLVGDPFRRWVRCDAKPQDLSPAVPHDQQSVEQSERDGRNDKQIHRRDPIGGWSGGRMSAGVMSSRAAVGAAPVRGWSDSRAVTWGGQPFHGH